MISRDDDTSFLMDGHARLVSIFFKWNHMFFLLHRLIRLDVLYKKKVLTYLC